MARMPEITVKLDEKQLDRWKQELIEASVPLRFFAFEHLPPHLQQVSRPFCELAHAIVHGDNAPEAGTVTFGSALPAGPERTVAIRKLLEAKDAAVRAAIEAQETN